MPNPAQSPAAGRDVSFVKLVDELVAEAYKLKASDIHIHPEQQNVRVRFRVDGVLRDGPILEKSWQQELISRIKILAGLRIDEHQTMQDGRFALETLDGRRLDLRVSVAPTYYGENAVLRLLADRAEEFTLEALGFSPADSATIRSALRRPYGLILATGPTGAGKTTTLYTLIKQLNTPETAIATLEDPIEYAIPGIAQIQVNSRMVLGFANGLRGLLRQDPNIIMVGEIRDQDTAHLAVNTALTGHLVLSTLHTNDAATTLPRLLDMGVEAYLIASTVNLAIGQRLLRKICPACKIPAILNATQAVALSGFLPLAGKRKFYRGRGCQECGHSGYSGRVGIYEVLAPGADMRQAVLQKAPAAEIRRLARASGMRTMAEDALDKAGQGLTTAEEILRMLYE